jgi:radical SAM modification target selenobiotic family peptide
VHDHKEDEISNHQLERRRVMEIKQLRKILASFGLAGLLATAGLTLSGCAKHPAGQTS